MRQWGLLLQLTEQAKGRLTATAKAGNQALWPPQFAFSCSTELIRQLTWRAVCHSSSYYVMLTFSQKYSIVRMAINGFVVMEKRPNLFTQVPASHQHWTGLWLPITSTALRLHEETSVVSDGHQFLHIELHTKIVAVDQPS